MAVSNQNSAESQTYTLPSRGKIIPKTG